MWFLLSGCLLLPEYECDDAPAVSWFTDGDGDGFGAESSRGCTIPTDGVQEGGDCDDQSSDSHPGATELCDGRDNDCDDLVDEDLSEIFYADADSDGFGNPTKTTDDCEAPAGYVPAGDVDCDDGDPLVYPGASVICCDGQANDCDAPDEVACLLPSRWALETATALPGELANSYAGLGLAGADIDGDGQQDLIVGAPGRDSGAVYVVAGPVSGGTLGTSRAAITGAAVGSAVLGSSIAAADVNGDGYGDVLLGAPEDDAVGQAVLLLGPLSGAVSGPDQSYSAEFADTWFGNAVALGDVDGDGQTDVFVGAERDSGASGAVFVYTTTLSNTATATLVGSGADDHAGYSLSIANDIDGDGADELIVGAPSAGGGTGVVYVVSGVLSGTLELADASHSYDGLTASSNLGYATSSGDADGDGYSDLILGAPGASTSYGDTGAVWLVAGSAEGPGELSDAVLFSGTSPGGRLGVAVAGGQDIDCDGVSDILVGAATDKSSPGRIYAVYGDSVLSNRTLDTDADVQLEEMVGYMLGHRLALPGDLDGDGCADVVAGAWASNLGAGTNAGAAWVFWGSGR